MNERNAACRYLQRTAICRYGMRAHLSQVRRGTICFDDRGAFAPS